MSNMSNFFGGGGSYAPEINQIKDQIDWMSNPNLLINPEFRVNQRGWVNGTVVVNGQTRLRDKWTIITEIGAGTIDGITANYADGVVDIPGSIGGSPDGTQIVTMEQNIEDLSQFSGKTVTASFDIKGSITGTVASYFYKLFDSATANSPENEVLVDVTTEWTTVRLTHTFPEFSGAVYGGYNNLTFSVAKIIGAGNSGFSVDCNYTGTLSIRNPKLEWGPVATRFDSRLIGEELALCKRYFERKDYITHIVNIYRDRDTHYTSLEYEEKRVNPTVTEGTALSNGAVVHYYSGSTPITDIEYDVGLGSSSATKSMGILFRTASNISGKDTGHVYKQFLIDADF